MHHFITDLHQQTHLDTAEAHHALTVLRIHPGEKVSVTDGNGTKWIGVLDANGGLHDVVISYVSKPHDITICISLISTDRLEWAIEKCTELGASKFIITQTMRSQVSIEHARRKAARFNHLIHAAIKQSGRCWIPSIEVANWKYVLDSIKTHDRALIAHAQSDEPTMRDSHTYIPALSTQKTLVLVGPEGGFTAEEVRDATERGCMRLTLSDAILRAETAAIVSVMCVR